MMDSLSVSKSESVKFLKKNEDKGDKSLLKIHRKLAYAAGNFITVLAISLWFPYTILFFSRVLKLSPQNAGYIVLLGQAGGAVATPFIGIWSDQCNCRVPGRRKIFHLIGVISTTTVFFFLWYQCLGCSTTSEAYKVLYYGSFAIMFQFGWAATQIGQLALMPELSSDKNVLVELNSLRYCFTLIANMFVFGCVWGLLEKFGDSITNEISEKDQSVFWIVALIIVGVGFLSSLPFQFFIPEKPNTNLRRLKWYKWFANPRFYLTALLLVGSRYIVLLPQTYMPQYFLDTLNMDRSSIAKGPLILYVSGFVTSFLVKRFRNFIGDKMTFFIGLAIVWGAVIFFWVKTPAATDTWKHKFDWHRDCIYIATLLLGSGGTIVLVIALSMVAFLVQNYKGSSAFVYGWVLFADRLSNGIGVNVIQQLTPSCDGVSSETCKILTADYYRHIMVYVPLGASAVGLIVIAIMAIMDNRKKRKTAPVTTIRGTAQAHDKPVEDDIKASVPNSRAYTYGINNGTVANDASLSYEDGSSDY